MWLYSTNATLTVMMVKWISGSDTSTSEVEIVDSESDNSVDIQA